MVMALPRLSALLRRWEEAFEQGQELTPEQLSDGRPELVEPLRQAIQLLRDARMTTVDRKEDPSVWATVPPTPQTDRPDELPPTTGESSVPPDYEILEELGRGGMGVVYKARQVGLNRLCALKMILSGAHAGPTEMARFRTEAEAIARLQHPNIVAVYEIGSHDGKPFFSLEFCSGGSLDRQLAGTPLEPMKAAKLVETLAGAMQAAHEANVVHRDLKPGNVLLVGQASSSEVSLESLTYKVTDF